MQDLLSQIDWSTVWNILWPLAVAFLSGTLTPTTVRRALWPLVCLIGRSARALSTRTAAAFRRKPDPELVALAYTIGELVTIQRAQTGYLQSLAAELAGTPPRLDVVSDKRKVG